MKKNTVMRTAAAFFLVVGGIALAAAPAQAVELPNAGGKGSITWQVPGPVGGEGSITWQAPAPVFGTDSITWQ